MNIKKMKYDTYTILYRNLISRIAEKNNLCSSNTVLKVLNFYIKKFLILIICIMKKSTREIESKILINRDILEDTMLILKI